MTAPAFDRQGIEERRMQRHHRGWHIIAKLVSARQHADADIEQASEVEADLDAALAEIDRLRAKDGDVMPSEWERLTADNNAATVLHYRRGQVWLDTDIDEADGLCIALGNSRKITIRKALAELEHRIADLRKALD